MTEEKNAIITGTFLGVEDHGIGTFNIRLNYGGSGQGAGGYALDAPIRDKEDKFVCRKGTARGMQAIFKILEVLEVDSWEKLIGEHVRVRATDDAVSEIGHVLKDRWFNFKDHFRKE